MSASAPSHPGLTSIQPLWAVPGGRVTLLGTGFDLSGPRLPRVAIDGIDARIVRASRDALAVVVPDGVTQGRAPVRVDGMPGETVFLDVGTELASGLHQVDNPAFDRDGNLYVTYSGGRSQQVPVSIFRVRPDGVRESFLSEVVNPTSLAFDARGRLYVSSRFEGTVYRVEPDGTVAPFVAELGVPCGLAFGGDGTLFVGDRSGTLFRVNEAGHATAFATLPPSVAAFHLAVGPDDALYVAVPTLATRDSVYRVDRTGRVEAVASSFGRPQGLAFDAQGSLYVTEALAGSSGLYRLGPDATAELVLSGEGLVGLAFDPRGGLAVASSEVVYRLDLPIRGRLPAGAAT